MSDDTRRFRIECDADGQPFVWEGRARNEAHAFSQAAPELCDEYPMLHVDRLRVLSCIELADHERTELATFGRQLQGGAL